MTNVTLLKALCESEGLPEAYLGTVERWWRPLGRRIATEAKAKPKGLLVGINGPQGSGKSTLCRFLEVLLDYEHGIRAATLSLDDLYLPKAKRLWLAGRRHPLFETRGVPGTHDVELGQSMINIVLASQGSHALPRFDKSTDDRSPTEFWPVVNTPLDVLLFEGWCVGAKPQSASELVDPVNELERVEDSSAVWRSFSNACLADDYAKLFSQIDILIMLNPPGFEQVIEWRMLQERKLIQCTGRGMDKRTLRRFVMHYERITRHMLKTMPHFADIVFEIAADHQPVSAHRLSTFSDAIVGEIT